MNDDVHLHVIHMVLFRDHSIKDDAADLVKDEENVTNKNVWPRICLCLYYDNYEV